MAIIPFGLYVVLNGVERPIRPEISLLGKSKFDIRRYTQNPDNGEVELDDSRTINRIVYALQSARSDRYDSLARSQTLVRAGKVTIDEMREALSKFDGEIRDSDMSVWGELMDSQPQLRGLELPKGKNALLYRGPWTVKRDYEIDVLTMHDPERDIVPVYVPEHIDFITQEWTVATEANPDTTHYTANLEYAEENPNGLNALRWDFGTPEWPSLESGWDPLDGNSGGALLGSILKIDEIVERFERTDL